MNNTSVKTIFLMTRIVFAFYLFLFLCNHYAIAQNESNRWFFGSNAGVDFNSGAPVAFGGGALISQEGCASVSDNLGNILFYTNGETVWNSSHVVMPGGTGLMGDNFSTQTAIIVPDPGNDKLYYIFTVSKTNGFRYSVVDMTSPGGNVTSMNNLLHASTTEKLTAVRDATGCNVWVIIHEWNSNAFYAFLVTNSGINSPVITNIGVTHGVVNGLVHNAVGCMKVSPDGSKLAAIHQDTRGFELFDFDNSTGALSNVVTVGPNYIRPYGLEFSPDGTKLYLSNQDPGPPQTTRVTQFDLTSANIPASAQLVGTSVTVIPGSLQIAPDNKIYLSRFNTSWLGVINNPNVLGASCNYMDNGFSIGTMQCKIGLPQTVMVAKNPKVNVTANVNVLCKGENTGSATVAASGGIMPYTFLWNTMPAQNTPAANGLAAGNYTVTVTDGGGCTSSQTVTITEPPLAITLTSTLTQTSCDANTGTAEVNAAGGTGTLSYIWIPTNQTSPTATGLSAGSYTVTVTDDNGCMKNTNATVEEIPCPCPHNHLTIPKAFSPNNDGENDKFCLQGDWSNCLKELRIIIYDRWGERVYESTDLKFCWEGTYKSKMINSGVFVYYLMATLSNGEQMNEKGNISLMK